MANCLLTISIIHLLLILFAENRFLNKYSLILQFVVGWLVLELAWVHMLAAIVLLIMALGDINDWDFWTVLGIFLTGYNLLLLRNIHRTAEASKQEFDKTLFIGLGEDWKTRILPERLAQVQFNASSRQWLKPFSMKNPGMDIIKSVPYGPEERNTLDIFRPIESSNTPRPVMLQIHGGGWVLGHAEYQALPLRNKLVDAGWVFVSINYRLSPKHRFPAHIIDCKRALAWIKENIAQYGGDPNFILTTGGSAGGHLCSLLALTANTHQPLLQPGFEQADTAVKGCIPVYGVYDFVDRNGHRTDLSMIPFLADNVMPDPLEKNPEIWDVASPIAQARPDRPPFFVLHGELDTLSFVEDAKYFVKTLRETSQVPCVYTELPMAQHAFDIFYSPRCVHAVAAMHAFAEYLYSDYLAPGEPGHGA